MIVVVGGGITGLALGWELARLGEDFVVLESSHRSGGVIRSGEVEGRVLDWGPQRLRLTRKVADMVRELGLEAELLTAPADLPLQVFARGRLRTVPLSLGAFVKSDALGLAAKARAFLEPFTRGPRVDETVADYLIRKLGRELYETLAGPLYGGLYASDPADMEVSSSLAHTLRELRVGRSLALRFLRSGGRMRALRACSFRSGVEALPAALGRSLGAKLILGAPVHSVRRRGSEWRVDTDGTTTEAEAVVLTTSAPVAASILRDEAPETASALSELRYNPLAVVHLHAERLPRTMGFQVALSERSRLLRGVTFNESLFGRARLCTAYLGGSAHPEVEHMSAEELGASTVSDLRACTGIDARVLSVEHVAMPAWDRSWRSFERVALPAGIHVAASWWSRPGVLGRLAEAEATARALAGGRRTSCATEPTSA